MLIENDEKKWLIKSSTRILGPFTKSEVFDLLKNKNVSQIDEVRNQKGRWNLIRESREFDEVIQLLREVDSHSDITVTSQTNSNNSFSKTENLYDYNTDPNQTFTGKSYTPSPLQPNIKDIIPLSEITTVSANPISNSAQSYGIYNDYRFVERVDTKSRFFQWLLFVFVFGSLAGYFGYNYWLKSRKSNSFQNSINAALRFKRIQLHEKAFEEYKKAKSIREPDLEIQAQMALYTILFEKDYNTGRKILERYLQSGEIKNPLDSIDYRLGIALSYLNEGDYAGADQAYLTLKNIANGNSSLLFLDRALLNLFLFDKQSDRTKLKDAYVELNPRQVRPNNEVEKNILFFARALALVFLANPASYSDEIKDLSVDLINQSAKGTFLRNELLFMNIELQSLLKSEQGVISAIDRYIESYPGLHRLSVHDPRIDWRLMNWEFLGKKCDELVQKIPVDVKSKLLKAHCLLETQRATEAQKLVDEAQAMSPGDPHLINTQIYILSTLNRITEAVALIKKNDSALFPMARFLSGQICFDNKDAECANTNFEWLYRNNTFPALGLFGLAQIEVKINDISKAANYVKQAVAIDENLLPLLELRDELDSM